MNIWLVPYVTDDVYVGVDKRSGEWCGCVLCRTVERCSKIGTKLNVLNEKKYRFATLINLYVTEPDTMTVGIGL